MQHPEIMLSIFKTKTWLCILFCLCVTGAGAQIHKALDIPTFINNYEKKTDTTLWYAWKQELAVKLKLPDLKTSPDSFHFRFWTDVQALDVWTADHITYQAMITNYARRFNAKKMKKGIQEVDSLFQKKVKLDTATARRIFNLLQKLSIIEIPSDDKIKGWDAGLDGVEYLIETSTPTKYAFKTYWTPRIFADSIPEAKRIQLLIGHLNNDFRLGNYYNRLKLPPGAYQRDGMFIEYRLKQPLHSGRWVQEML
jgi:hypothetical protein